MKNVITITGMIFALTFITGCTNRNDAQKALSAEGYTNIQITGFDLFACGRDDFYHTGFKATNKEGRTINGTVCSGILKKATIRY